MVELSRVVVTGGNSAIAQELDFGIRLSHAECDVTNPSCKDAIQKHNPSAILHLASVPIRLCETNPFEAYRINVFGTKNIAEIAKSLNIPLIVISTGAVFDGNTHAIFFEESPTNPQNIYGQTKNIAEIIVRASSPKNLIVRTGWLFGLSNKKDGFSGFIEKAITSLKENAPLKGTPNQKGSPTYVEDFAQALTHAIENGKTGTIHLINEGGASAFEILTHIKHHLNSHSEIVAVSLADVQGPKRSASEVLGSKTPLPSWKNALERYLQEKNRN